MIGRAMWSRWIVIVCLGVSCAASGAPPTMPARLDKTKPPVALRRELDPASSSPHEIDVPDDWYVVRLSGGADPTASNRTAYVEGVPANVPGAVPVRVGDRRLTIVGAGVAAVELRSAHDPR